MVSDIFKMIMNFMLNNQYSIDSEIYFAIVIGQIAIYGVLLTFYQFVISYQGSLTNISYLGKNVIEYLVKKETRVFNMIISRKLFDLLFVMEILYKPFTVIFGRWISNEKLCVMNCIWYGFVIFYFITFLLLFFQCRKCILKIKQDLNVKINGSAIYDINKMFLKRKIKEYVRQSTVDLLNRDLTYLGNGIKRDDNPKLQKEYNSLIREIFKDYVNRKQYEISRIETKGKVLKNQVHWMYNSDNELRLLREILSEKYFVLDEENLIDIFHLYVGLLRLNLKRARLAGYEKVKCDRYESVPMKEKGITLDISEWIILTEKIYLLMSDEKKQEMICILNKNTYENCSQDFFALCCNECINLLLRAEIDRVFEGERQQLDIKKIYNQVLAEEGKNDLYTEIIKDKLISYKEFDAKEIIDLLSPKNCTYVFAYLLIYYSVYKFRFEWNYINVRVLKLLWKKHDNMREDAEDAIKKIHNSNVGHRFEEEMYIKLMEYVQECNNEELWKKAKKQKMIDPFYIWIIRMCVIDNDDMIYVLYNEKLDLDTSMDIINELSKHVELLVDENIRNWVQYVSSNLLVKQKNFPERMKISLRSLLLTNINIETVVEFANENQYRYFEDIGAYLLIKLFESLDKFQNQKEVKEFIKMSYYASNLSVEAYISMLENECILCNYKIEYITKEKMKEYLIKIF